MNVRKMTDAELNARFTKAYEVARKPRVIDVVRPSPMQLWRDASFTTQLAAVVILGFILPWAIIIFGLVGLGLWDEFFC